MEGDDIPTRLRHLAFTRGFASEQLDRLAELSAPVQWEPDAVIFREGEVGKALYLVEEGRVAIELLLPGRGRTTILTVGRGQVFGWSSVFYERPKTTSARAVVATTALALDAPRLRGLCDADPQLGYVVTGRLLETVSERLKATRIQLLDLFAGPPNHLMAQDGGRP
jgi:CRP/FNR family transcriptional regulator, cyclic AMP receptor protein